MHAHIEIVEYGQKLLKKALVAVAHGVEFLTGHALAIVVQLRCIADCLVLPLGDLEFQRLPGIKLLLLFSHGFLIFMSGIPPGLGSLLLDFIC